MPGTPGLSQANQKPPLTSELFNNQYDQWMRSFPKAGGLAAEIRPKLNQSGVESLLRIEANKKNNPARQKQLRQLPLYFRVLFNEVSGKYIRPEQTCYFALIQLINDLGFDKVVVISLNYDTLFEQALERALDLSFSVMSDYFDPARAWKILKPHGSVNWVKRIKDSESAISDVATYVSFIDGLEKLNYLDAEPVIDLHPDKWRMSGKAIYPQLTIPMEGKYDYFCPEEHVKLAKELIAECGAFCLIGSSMKDDDVVNDVIKVSLNKPVKALIAVTGDAKETGNETFVERTIACFGRMPSRVHKEGFRGFIQTREADKFLSSI